MRRTGFPASVVERVLTRSGGECEAMLTGCTITAEHLHHRRVKAMGGSRQPSTNTAANALYLCLSCHARIHGQPRWAVDNGFLVAQHHEPTERAVWWRSAHTPDGRKLFVLLDDFGNRATLPARRPA